MLPGTGAASWHPACGAVSHAGAGVRLEGLDTGAILRPVPGRDRIDVQLRALGGDGTLWWMLDGKPVRRTDGASPVSLRFTSNGAHTVTVMDEGGRYDSVRFAVRGLPEHVRNDGSGGL